ncbi:hypothetical protein ACHAWF_014581 [Thalassiosira exigua]
MTSLPSSIKFNVGGRHFEVSRDLIEQQPESMLRRMVSEAWHPDTEKTIFIDRNSDIFAQAMEYLRYGSVVLPVSMPKEMFFRDVDYYGLSFEDGAIKDGDEVIAELKEENARMKNEVIPELREENARMKTEIAKWKEWRAKGLIRGQRAVEEMNSSLDRTLQSLRRVPRRSAQL